MIMIDPRQIPDPAQVGFALFNAPPPRVIAPEGKCLPKSELKHTASARAKRYLEWYCIANKDAAWHWCEYDMSRGPIKWKLDHFGFADAVLIHEGFHALQVTAGGHGQDRVKKILGAIQPKETPEKAAQRRANAHAWLTSGGTITVWDYRRRTRAGLVVEVERVVIPVTQEDF